MTELSAHDRHLLDCIDRDVRSLATADAAADATALASILDCVRRTGPAGFGQALAALRQTAAHHAIPTVRVQLAKVLTRIDRMPRSALPKALPSPGGEARVPRATMLTVASMQPGARYRVVQDFVDFDGTPFRAGTVLTFASYSYFPYDGGYTIAFREGGMRLAEIDAANVAVIENHGNAYFAPGDDPAPA